jgi:NAD(P)H-hydrate epimerase
VTLGQTTASLSSVAAQQYRILQRMGVPVEPDPRRADVVIDALIGYSLRGSPRGRIGELIGGIGDAGGSIVSLDTPSGVNVTDGSVPGLAVSADATMTLALPKVGLRNASQLGALYLADISVPPSVYTAMGVGPVPDFSRSSILRLVDSESTTE